MNINNDPYYKTDNEIVGMLNFIDEYYAAYRFEKLKKENTTLKGKITRLKKKLND